MILGNVIRVAMNATVEVLMSALPADQDFYLWMDNVFVHQDHLQTQSSPLIIALSAIAPVQNVSAQLQINVLNVMKAFSLMEMEDAYVISRVDGWIYFNHFRDVWNATRIA